MFNRIINWMDDKINPIAVKELRQSTNSRILSVLVIAFLAIQLFCLYIQIFWEDAASFDRRQTIFPTVLTVLFLSCIYGIIPTVANRFYKELNGDSIDLIYTTVLSPFAVIFGKTLSAMGLIILLYSLCTPFIFISYLFPGIDILTIFLSLWYSFWIIAAIAQSMILISTIRTSKIMRGVILLIYFGIATIFSASFGFEFLNSYHGGSFIHIPFYSHILFIIFWLLMIGFLYILAVTAITSVHANRAFWPRVYAAALWVVGFVTVVLLYAYNGTYSSNYLSELWLVASLTVFLAFMGIASGERASYGKRLRRGIPRKRFLRFLVFPFFSGEINGVIYSMIFLVLTVLTLPVLDSINHRLDFKEGVIVIVGLAGYFTWYSLLALQIKRMFVNRFPNINSFLVMLFAVITFTLLPMLLAWGIHRGTYLRDEELAPFLVLSFGIMLIKSYAMVGMLVSWSLSGFTFIILLPFIRRRINEFKPLNPVVEESRGIEYNG